MYVYTHRYLIDTEVPDTDNDLLETVFFAICVASTFFGLLSILVMGLGCNQLINCRRVCGITATNWYVQWKSKQRGCVVVDDEGTSRERLSAV